jgi:hypothetical protein
MQGYGCGVVLFAASNFSNNVGEMNWIALACLILGFVFCVLVAMIRVMIGENKIVSAALLIIVVAVVWIGYENASEFSTYSALGLAFNLVPVQTAALSTESMNQLLGGAW